MSKGAPKRIGACRRASAAKARCPVKVTRTALQSAASVAALILITEATINEIPKEGPDLSALAGAGAGGMGGMM